MGNVVPAVQYIQEHRRNPLRGNLLAML